MDGLYWEREDKLTHYSGTEKIDRLVIVGQRIDGLVIVGQRG